MSTFSAERSAGRSLARFALATVVSAAVLVPGAGNVRAQEAEPVITDSSVECIDGGFGVLRVKWSGPFPYPITVLASGGLRREIERGDPNNEISADFSAIKYNPAMTEAPGVSYHIGRLSENPAQIELDRTRLQRVDVLQSCPEPGQAP
jgi:hypothetical protein